MVMLVNKFPDWRSLKMTNTNKKTAGQDDTDNEIFFLRNIVWVQDSRPTRTGRAGGWTPWPCVAGQCTSVLTQGASMWGVTTTGTVLTQKCKFFRSNRFPWDMWFIVQKFSSTFWIFTLSSFPHHEDEKGGAKVISVSSFDILGTYLLRKTEALEPN